MSALIQGIASVMQPWSDLYNDSTALQTIVVFAHLAGMLVAGGFAIATDRRVLIAGRVEAEADVERTLILRDVGQVHRPVVVALAIVVVSGIAMALADAETMLGSWIFWAKMALFVLLLVNGLFLQRSERRVGYDPRAWNAVRGAGLRSMGLWGALLFFGVLLLTAS